jgi:F-type H+-transporting ATPase subunit b
LTLSTGAARVRPSLVSRTLPTAATSLTTSRFQSNVPQKDPKTQAQSIIDSLPGSSIASKTAILSAGAGLSIAAISNELYVVNEESVVAFSLLSVFWAVAHYGGPMYKEWAEGQNHKIKGILNAARDDHTNAVKQRIDSVKSLGGVVDVTRDLFAVSKVCCHE